MHHAHRNKNEKWSYRFYCDKYEINVYSLNKINEYKY